MRACHGLPSGVKATNLLGTIINLIALDFCTNQGKNFDFGFAAGGDDFCIMCRKFLNPFKFIENFKKRALEPGMEVKFLELRTSERGDLSSFPCFYKYVVKDGFPFVPTASMLERVFMPWNRKYSSGIDIIKFLNDIMPSLGTPGTHLILYDKC